MPAAQIDTTNIARPAHFRDRCPDCTRPTIPREVDLDPAGYFAVYVCCDGVWTKGFPK